MVQAYRDGWSLLNTCQKINWQPIIYTPEKSLFWSKRWGFYVKDIPVEAENMENPQFGEPLCAKKIKLFGKSRKKAKSAGVIPK